MREIKFRTWDGKRFHYWGFGVNGAAFTGPLSQTGQHLIHEQFTGLKDKNGKEICEGDIVCCDDDGEYFPQKYDEEKDEYLPNSVHVVIGPTDTDPSFDIEPNHTEFNGLCYALETWIEVIGNIHEHRELLK